MRISRVPLDRLTRFVFGDDIFISYARADASDYAPALAARLDKYTCFLDQINASPGREISEEIRRKIRDATVFVLVGTQAAASSDAVAEEIEEFLKTGRPIIPINVDHALEKAPWYERLVRGMAIAPVARSRRAPDGAERAESTQEQAIPEGEGALVLGEPSRHVIRRIESSFLYTRRRILVRWLVLGTIAFAAIGIGATYLVSARRVTAADREVATARGEERSARDSARRARQDADSSRGAARAAADTAAAMRDAADAQRKLADTQRRLAAAERARAAAEALKVMGSSTTLAARAPGNEVRALRAVVEMSGSVRTGTVVPAEVRRGMADALTAAGYSLPLPDYGGMPGGYVGAGFVDRGDGTRLVTARRIGRRGGIPRLEVRRWDGCLESAPVRLQAHPDSAAEFVALSPDGLRIATRDPAGAIYVSSTETGVPLARLDGRETAKGPNVHAEFSRNGSRLLVIADMKARLWTVGAGRPTGDGLASPSAPPGRAPPVRAGAFSPDPSGTLVATAGDDGTVTLWDAGTRTPKHVADFTGPRGSVLMAVGISAGGARLVAGDTHGGTYGWLRNQPRTPDSVRAGFDGADPLRDSRVVGQISAVAFSPDGREVVVTSYDHTARVLGGYIPGRAPRAFEETGRLLGHTEPVAHAAYSADGSRILTASFDGTARIWTSLGIAVATLRADTVGGTSHVSHAAFSHDSGHARVVTLTEDGRARIWDTSQAARYAWGSGERLNQVYIRGDLDAPDDIRGTPLIEACRAVAPGGGDHVAGDAATARYMLTKYPNGAATAPAARRVRGIRE